MNMYKAFFENTYSAFFIGKPDGSIIKANEAACKMFGYSLEELQQIGRDRIIASDTPGLKERFKERDGKRGVSGELIGIRKNGERFWCEFSSSIFKGSKGEELTSVMMIDISEKKQTEFNRIKLTDELKKVFSFAPDMICTAGFDGYFKTVNPAASELLEYSEEELLSQPFVNFLHLADVQKTAKELSQVQIGKSISNLQNRFISKSGKIIWLSWSVKIFYDENIIYSVAKDITVQKELELLHDQATRLAKIGSWELDLNVGKMYWSAITNEIHEADQNYIPDLEKTIHLFKEGESREKIKNAIKEAIEHGKSWDLELQIVTLKGNDRWIQTIGEAENVDGTCVRLYGSIQDINEKKTIGEKLRSKTRHLEAISKLNSALLNYREWYNALNENLGVIGEAVRSDRVYYFENHFDPKTGEGFTTQILEWCRDGIEPQLKNPDLNSVPFKKLPELIDPMLERCPTMGILTELDQNSSSRQAMENQQIKAFLTIPVMVKDTFHGFVGFDNCTEERYWSDEEVEMLKTITSNLAIAVERDFVDRELMELFKEKNSILESINDAFYTIDENWKITYFNKEAERILDRKSEDLIGKSLWEEFPSTADTELYDKYLYVMMTREALNFEYYFTPLESWYEISAYPSEGGISVYLKNIDERKESQEKILYKSRLIEAIANINSIFLAYDDWMDALYESITIIGKSVNADRVYYFESHTLPETGEIVASQKLEWVKDEQIIQINNPELQDLPIEIFQDFFEKMINQNIYSDQVCNISDKELKSLLDSQNILSILIIPVFVKQQFHGFIGFDDCRFERNWTEEETSFLRSLTTNLSYAIESFQADIELRNLHSELQSKVKALALSNEELEQFAFVASHDLQEPLRMITSFLALIERNYDKKLDDKGRSYIRYATDGAKRMRKIILDLLNYSRVGKTDLEKTAVDLNEIIIVVLSLNRKIIEEKEAQITWDELPTVHAVYSQVQQLFQNLIHNALNYQKPDQKPVVHISLEETSQEWKINVMDNGIGINPEYQDKIFNIFQRLHTNEEYSGTGVGLAICKKIIDENGGSIGVVSEEGHGSTFYFTLPKDIMSDVEEGL